MKPLSDYQKVQAIHLAELAHPHHKFQITKDDVLIGTNLNRQGLDKIEHQVRVHWLQLCLYELPRTLFEFSKDEYMTLFEDYYVRDECPIDTLFEYYYK